MDKTEKKQEEVVFTKEQILASKKYLTRRDALKSILPDDFQGTLKNVDSLLRKFMKGKVN